MHYMELIITYLSEILYKIILIDLISYLPPQKKLKKLLIIQKLVIMLQNWLKIMVKPFIKKWFINRL